MKDTKKRILEKAIDLFYEKGFVKASIRDIVKAVGVTNSTVYIHYKNKDQILYQIIHDIGLELIEILQGVMEENDDTIVCLYEMIFKQTLLVKRKRKEIKIYIEEQYQLPKSLKTLAVKQQRQIYDIYHNKICELGSKSALKNGISKIVIVFAISSMMNWTYRWFKEDKSLSISQVAENNINILLNGILTEEYVTDKLYEAAVMP